MSVTVKMSGDERDLVKAQERVEKGAAGITAEYKKLAKESLETQRFAKKAWEESGGAAEVYKQKLERLKAEYAANNISADQYRAGVAKLEAQHQSLGATGSKGLKAIGAEVVGLMGPLASVSGAVGAIVSGVNTWVENTRDLAKVTRETMKDMVAFAALQEPGTTRQRAMRVLEASRGAATFAEAFDLVQAMQSATNSFEEGLKIAKDVWTAQRVGIPAELGGELATQAVAQGYPAGKFLREAYIAGAASVRDPKAVAKLAPALDLFADKTWAVAMGAQIAATKPKEAESMLRGVAASLTPAGPLEKYWEQQRVAPGVGQRERLEMLQKSGIDTIEELNAIGLKEIERVQAMVAVLKKYDKVLGFEKTIKQQMDGGVDVFVRDRAKIETDLPEARMDRLAAEEESRFREMRAFDQNATRRQLYERLLVSELAARGVQQAGFLGNAYDNEGQLSVWRYWGARALEMGNIASPFFAQTPFADASRAATQKLEAIERNTVPLLPRPRVPTPEQ